MNEGNDILKVAAVRILLIAGLIIAVSLAVFGLSVFNSLLPRFEFVANGITIAIGYTAFKAHRVRDGFAALLVWYVLLLAEIHLYSPLNTWILFMEASYIVGLTAAVYLLFLAIGKQFINGWIQRIIAAAIIIGVAHGLMVIFLEIVSRRMFSHPIKTLEWSYTNLKTGVVIGILAAVGMELAEYVIKFLVFCFINNFTMYQDFRIMGTPHILEGTHENRTPKTARCARTRAISPVKSYRMLTEPAPWSCQSRKDCAYGSRG